MKNERVIISEEVMRRGKTIEESRRSLHEKIKLHFKKLRQNANNNPT